MDAKRYVGVLVKCNDKILLCKRNNQGSFPGMWSIPAGKLEENESTKEGAKREFFEETAININDVPLKFIGLVPRHTRDGKKIKGLMYVYLLETNEELHPDFEKATDGEEHTDYGYFTKEQLEQNKIGTYLFRLLEIILEKD
jgi:ADP-ribose pyrophosphatase YjhB (NUDIX family)